MTHTKCLLLAVFLMYSGNQATYVFGRDSSASVSIEELCRKENYEHSVAGYRIITGKTPDYTNLVETLRSPKALPSYKDIIDSRLSPESQLRKGLVPGSRDCTVVNQTLHVLLASDRVYPELTNEIVRVYSQSTDWRVRRNAAEVLGRYKSRPDERQFVRDLLARAGELKNVAYRTETGMEMESVLEMVRDLDKKDVCLQEVTNVLTRCYHANSDLSIRRLCRQAMEKYDTSAAERFRREEMRHPDCSHEGKLLLAKEFLAKGDPYGYPVLREGLMSQEPEKYGLAATLLEGLWAFDGKPYDESGELIDLRAVLRDVAATNDLVVAMFRKDHVRSMKMNTNRPRAIELCRQRMNYSRALWLRIGYARVFLEESGWLFGYPVLKVGLLSHDAYTRDKAMELLEAFRKHDGKVYDDEGHTVNIQALLGEVEKAVPK